MTKVAWPSMVQSGGNLAKSQQEKIRKLINNFGEVLDEQCKKKRLMFLTSLYSNHLIYLLQ